MLKIILLWMMLLGAVVPAYTESKRAFKLLEKGEWDKLVELLDKSIEKDSIKLWGEICLFAALPNT
jgi:hypothetical protein